MIDKADLDLFRRILPRKGYLLKRWGPVQARRIDRLVQAGLVTWSTEGSTRATFGMRHHLTPKGKIVRSKL